VRDYPRSEGRASQCIGGASRGVVGVKSSFHASYAAHTDSTAPVLCCFASSMTAEDSGSGYTEITQRAPRNKVVAAIADKLARLTWAVLSSGKDYRLQPLQPSGRESLTCS
jgi:hypothetical protein